MEKSNQRVGKVFLVFAVICVLVLPLVIFSAFSYGPSGEGNSELTETRTMDFDYNGNKHFETFYSISRDYLEGTSTERTLEEYYSRRQYAGSPPYIPHKIEEKKEAEFDCLSCHAQGGWTQALKRHTPVTPHPDFTACRQCHVPMTTDELFTEHHWVSLRPPGLGRPELPGAPPLIPHGLQMRGNCIPCHVGPGAVTAIRVEHPSRGSCRQCHVPDYFAEPFQRKAQHP
jgi:nitrate reductase (cytochrome), electron transfer subunit